MKEKITLCFLAAFAFCFAILLLIFSLPPKNSFSPNLDGEFDLSERQAVFNNEPVKIPTKILAEKGNDFSILGETSGGKRIEVDLTNQRVYAFEGGTKVYDFLISSGKWGKTPTGVFEIRNKFLFTKMSGGSKALHTYYYLPNVPFVMFFGNSQIPASRGFSLHGTYWHSNFGHPMSHGCVNMKTEDAKVLYYWANPQLGDKKSVAASKDNPGTKVIIYGTTPKS